MSQRKRVSEPSLLLINHYIGIPLPSYVDLFLKSCEANPSVNWLLVTDQPVDRKTLPKNVRVKKTTFTELVTHISDVMGFEVNIPYPYKICEFRPAYGLIFAREIEGFDFWGCCDMDVIFGNLRKFLTRDLFDKYDKLLIFSHLSISRNSESANNFFRLQAPGIDYRDVFRSPNNKWFDEWPGMGELLRFNRIPFFDGAIYADIDVRYCDFRVVHQQNYKSQIFCYENGSVYQEFWHDGQLGRKEYAYIHLQKRTLPAPSFSPETAPHGYFITPKGFYLRDGPLTTVQQMKRLNPKGTLFQRIAHTIAMYRRRLKGHITPGASIAQNVQQIVESFISRKMN